METVLELLQAVREKLQAQLNELDEGIAGAPNEQSRLALEKRREIVAGELSDVDKVIANYHARESGKPLDEAEKAKSEGLRKDQYKMVRRLATAVQAYLLHTPGCGPIRVPDLVQILDHAGVRVAIRNGPKKGQRIPVKPRHIRVMANNYKTGFAKTGKPSPFLFDEPNDTIALNVAAFEEPEPAKGRARGQPRLVQATAQSLASPQDS